MNGSLLCKCLLRFHYLQELQLASIIKVSVALYAALSSQQSLVMHLQKNGSKQQQQLQQDKAGTQITLLKAGCMDALLPLVGASSVVLRSQVNTTLQCMTLPADIRHYCPSLITLW